MSAPLIQTPVQILAQILVQTIEMNLAACAAVLVVLAVRGHVQRLLGPGAAYLMWAAVPAAMLAMLIPARTIVVAVPVASLSGKPWSEAISPLAAMMLGVVWITGALVMAGLMAVRQRQFMRDVDIGLAGPAVIGFLRPHVVTPSDFATRFTHVEQQLILAHEAVHIERHDARTNAFAALARCVFWFNPLMHVGVRMMRADQEAACDALVIARRPRTRRVYAETLLKTQMNARALPVGCYWPADDVHPLAERIAMLTRKPFSDRRRIAAASLAVLAVAGGGVAAWAAQPAHQVLTPADEAEMVWVHAVKAGPAEIVLTFSPLDRSSDGSLAPDDAGPIEKPPRPPPS